MKDRANRRVRGLWLRNGSYYVQTTVVDANTGLKKVTKIRLEKASDIDSAKTEAGKIRQQIEQGETVHGRGGPAFGEYKDHYLKHAIKKPTTLESEKSFLNNWCQFLGSETRIGAITKQNVLAFQVKLRNEGYSARTANLHTICLRNILKMARIEGYTKTLPTDGVKPIKVVHVERKLLASEDIDRFCAESIANHKRSGKMFADYIRLMAFCGGRRSETLKLKWSDVDFDNKVLVFKGSDTKNSQTRRVDFNTKLESHLKDMFARKDGEMLFGSFRTGNAVRSFNTTIRLIRAKLGIPEFTNHLLRHYFISTCVMSGIDFLTIAKWVGHQDGGILIGKVYGHLSRTHMKSMAQKVSF